jgi:hypothetical protein
VDDHLVGLIVTIGRVDNTPLMNELVWWIQEPPSVSRCALPDEKELCGDENEDY